MAGFNFAPSALVTLCLAVVVTSFMTKLFSLSGLLLRSLTTYHVPNVVGSDVQNAKQKAKSAKAEKKAAKKEIYLGGAESLSVGPIPSSFLPTSDSYQLLDSLLFFLVLSFNVTVLISCLSGASSSNHLAALPFFFSIVAVAFTIYCLFHVDLISKYTRGPDKVYVLTCGIVAFVISFAVLHYTPVWLADFGFEAAAKDASAAFTSVFARYNWDPAPVVNIYPVHFKIPLILFSALVSMLMFQSAFRTATCLNVAARPPQWMHDYQAAKISSFWVALLQLDFVFLVAYVLLWIAPLSTEMWGLTNQQVQLARASCLLAFAVIHGMGSRTLMQGYLNTGLISWWTMKHGKLNLDTLDKARQYGKLIQQKLLAVNFFVSRVALQMVAPACIAWSTGTILLISVLAAPVDKGGLGKLPAQAVSSAIVESSVGVFALAFSTAWSVYMGMCYFLTQTGVMGSS